MAKSTNSRSMRYTCLDVRSPDVNFLRKVMSSSRHDGAAYSRHPCRQSADADIVSAFPLSFSTFLENINILRQTSSTWHRILREFCVLESFQKPVALAGYKNKQCRKQTSVLSGRIVTAYVPLRSATERERAAFLIPCQGLRGLDTIFFANSQVSLSQIPQKNEFRTKKILNQEFLYEISSFCTLSENNSLLHGNISCFCIFLAKNGVFNTNRTPRVADSNSPQ